MPERNSTPPTERSARVEDFVPSADHRSLRKGRRVAPRTEVCRPCLVWSDTAPEEKMQGVLLDLNPHGMRVRMLDSLPEGGAAFIQMMRDDDFEVPLSAPIRVNVVRVMSSFEGFIDHGVRVVLASIRRAEAPPPIRPKPLQPRRRLVSRMHTVDFTVGDRSIKKAGR